MGTTGLPEDYASIESAGIIPRAVNDIFAGLRQGGLGNERWEVRVSYLELYQEVSKGESF